MTQMVCTQHIRDLLEFVIVHRLLYLAIFDFAQSPNILTSARTAASPSTSSDEVL